MKSKKKQDVIDTATKLFSEHGFHTVGVDLIIKKSNVARMTMYRNFSGKDDLVKEVLIQRNNDIISEIKKITENARKAKEKIKLIFDWYEKWFKSDDFYGCLFERAIADFGKDTTIVDIAVGHKEAIQKIIFEILLSEYNNDVSIVLSKKITMVINGAISNAHIFNDPKSAKIAWGIVDALIKE
ncbi:TetR/AcrR family transcriptional regulator [Klebsiella pneumoniae subsp. pneumoniae]|uniref:TetR/AcrR family transcriptional regulator n=1 Tax=Klebsiella pneumoniae TaxID=573 RepID=UPI0021B2F41C|nr:TetR/AcrR family transcriptional regulator [Klebsiella pneumoniae]MCT6795051.1 TetR/AcrR family transcriptional regulator [Klebsiella pneumoniae subsp. pneumoniae]